MRRGRRLLARRPAPRRRTICADALVRQRREGGDHTEAVQRPDPCTRVRRRVVPRNRVEHLLREFRRPTPVSPRHRRPGRPDHTRTGIRRRPTASPICASPLTNGFWSAYASGIRPTAEKPSTSSSCCPPTDQHRPARSSRATTSSRPRVSVPDGQQLAWLTWDHPRMPWDGTELWVGDFQPDGSVSRSAPGCRRTARVDLPTRVESDRCAALRLGPHGMVEPIPSRAAIRPRRWPRWRPNSVRRNGFSACPGMRS